MIARRAMRCWWGAGCSCRARGAKSREGEHLPSTKYWGMRPVGASRDLLIAQAIGNLGERAKTAPATRALAREKSSGELRHVQEIRDSRRSRWYNGFCDSPFIAANREGPDTPLAVRFFSRL